MLYDRVLDRGRKHVLAAGDNPQNLNQMLVASLLPSHALPILGWCWSRCGNMPFLSYCSCMLCLTQSPADPDWPACK